jgi:hypothetical protein
MMNFPFHIQVATSRRRKMVVIDDDDDSEEALDPEEP